MWLSCGGSVTAGSTKTSGLSYRAFIINNVSSGTAAAGVYIINALKDQLAAVPPISGGNTPRMMVVTPNRAQTLVFSGNGTQSSDNKLTIIDNSKEAASGGLTLPGMTESFVVSPDSSTAYVAVPTAPVVGQPPGIVAQIYISNASLAGEVNIPSVQFLSMDNSGNRILGFSEGSVADTVAVITPSNIGIPNAQVVTFVGGFDHPVAAFFSSDDTTAYVLNCGAECGGTQASLQTLDLTTNTPGPPGVVCTPGGNPPCAGTLNLVAGSVALVNNSTMYVAGTPVPASPCTGQTTAATTCGLLTIVDLNTMSVTNAAPIVITDGYHNRIALAANGQLFIGANTCTEIIPPIPPPTGAETRGCLSIYNTLSTAVGSTPSGGVLIPPENGDVTGFQPIVKRYTGGSVAQQVIYVVQGGSLDIYDVTTDALAYNPYNTNNPGKVYGLVGDFMDVKMVDF
jgi:hypothetical protein